MALPSLHTRNLVISLIDVDIPNVLDSDQHFYFNNLLYLLRSSLYTHQYSTV